MNKDAGKNQYVYHKNLDTDWRKDAACAGKAADPNVGPIWDMLTNSESRQSQIDIYKIERIQRAISYCSFCPVRTECLNEAMSDDVCVRQGVYGGIYYDGWVQRRKGRKAA